MKYSAVAAAIGAIALAGCASPPPSAETLQAQYQQAVLTGAVRPQPAARPMDRSTGAVSVAALSKSPNLDRRAPVKVALASELLAACRANLYPLVTIQRVMGLPPDLSADFHVFIFEISPRQLTPQGRSYNWDPASTTHQGLYTYLVRPGAGSVVRTVQDPATFCSGSD